MNYRSISVLQKQEHTILIGNMFLHPYKEQYIKGLKDFCINFLIKIIQLSRFPKEKLIWSIVLKLYIALKRSNN